MLHIRRARRAEIAAQVDRELPGLADGERLRVLEERLGERAAIEAEDFVWRRERDNVLAMLGGTEAAQAEARRAYEAEQGRPWFRHNPNGADAIAAATKAADTARERTAQYLLATRLEQLREQAAARTKTVAAAPWSDRLAGLAARSLDGGTAGAVMACAPS
ncbi:hypothetical protein ACFWWT_46365 [Streptomyces sp. NPDC058676]|uniref:hypothetical protein n=1 Tax=unclassified Streptomyces TaxID=2593676 RepID=UPI00364FE704